MNLLIKITWQLTDQNTKEGKVVACLHATASCSLQISLSSVSWSEKQFNQVILSYDVSELLSSLHVHEPQMKLPAEFLCLLTYKEIW